MKSIMEIAMSQYGVKEISGKVNNRTIVDYAKEAGFEWVNDENTPWCSIFANWVAMKAGLPRSGKANARSWLSVGKEVTEPESGDVVVFSRGNSELSGHVAFYVNELDGFVNVIGGNQSDQVKISAFSKESVLGYRRLT